ncbi:helix-turn-helix transcriptional regulator [Micromonospora sp. HUAS LYJ1]|uniref:helix-turn-helix domain-containing protein n=1 Tax=Micromonospora sp. HUAS LYJ1 TaxID=3061626 RepID=UPI002673DD12|nr:helix-turn-helix transcriptional regulator [Micromonospora sp. HUAS LYJ1]WKU04476.1 helix-turn-helix transcriptional regulator [Micromonospora sp. HUAS LYJ1]
MAGRRYPSNRRLAWERLQRGWSYEEVAERIRTEMSRAGETDTGLNANTVRRWEIGERRPDPRYRKHLVAMFGKPASDLGLLTPDELAVRPDEETLHEFRRLWDMLTGDNNGNGWDRASVLRALVGASMLPLVAPLLSLDPEAAHADGKTVDPDSYRRIVSCQRELYWTCPARPLYEAAYAHTQLGIGLLRAATGGSRNSLASALAESALLTARLAFFDLSQPAIAERCYDVALAATREAGDHALAAAVLGHMAFVPAFGHQPANARPLIDGALQYTWHGVSPMVRSWLHCVASEVEARAGAAAASRRHIDLAAGAVNGDGTPPEWLDFYDNGRLHSFAGYAALACGDHSEAAGQLNQALAALTTTGAKQRSVVLADLATAHRGDGDRAADYLNQAVDALQNDWYGVGLDRVRAVRTVLGDSRHGNLLDERVAALTAGRAALPGS